MRLSWTDQALEELEEILDYIARDSPQNAQLVGSRIESSVQTILGMPFIGKAVRMRKLRQHEVPKTGFLVLYSVSKTSVTIASVRRGSRGSVHF